ncbi:DUF4238 domain-containing protein [Vibrio clamense]|uniref:DUF4238 domain-containing protein n=1 Tax=Vibrio clamense TaxID=2910254 RepID=UPI003D1E80FE
MAIDGIAKNQHYVPQFILRNFSFGKREQVCVFDKSICKKFSTNVRNVASENGFYNFKLDDEMHSLEPHLGEIEDLSAVIINKIVKNASLENLSLEDKKTLSYFMAIQFVRTKDYREHFKDGATKLREALKSRGLTDEILDHSGICELSDEEVKECSLEAIKNAESLIPYFYNKDWTIQKASSDVKFYISDHPVSMKNFHPNTEFMNNVGLAVEGIEVYFPISKNFTLGMYCPTLLQSFKKELLIAKANFALSYDVDSSIIEAINHMEELVVSFETGSPLLLGNENVIHLNSLQVMNGNRFVYSCNDSFELVERMLTTCDSFQTGRRSSIR